MFINDMFEDSWSDGQNAWSSEHDQWTKESVEAIPALTGVDESTGYYYEQLAQAVYANNPELDTSGQANDLVSLGFEIAADEIGRKKARYLFAYDEDFASDFVSAYAHLQQRGWSDDEDKGLFGDDDRDELDEYRGPHDKVTFEVDSENAYNHIMQKYGHIIDWDGDYMTIPERYWPAVQELAYAAGGDVQEIGIDENAEQLPPGMSRGFDFGPQVKQWKAAIQKKYQRLGNIEFKDLRRHIPKDGSWATTAIVKNPKTGNYVILGNASGNSFTPEKIKFEIYDTPRELSLNVNEAGSDWEDEAEQAERFYQMVVKKLSAINSPSERESVAGQLSKIEQKYFGARSTSTLSNGVVVTPIVNSVLIALRAGRAPTANSNNNNPNGVVAVGQRPQTPPGGHNKPMFDYTSPEVKEFLAAARNELLSATDTYELEKIIDGLSRKQINSFRDVEWQEDDGMIVTKDILRLTLKLKDRLGHLSEPGKEIGELPDVSDADIDNADLEDLESYLHDLLNRDEVDEGWKQNLAALGTAAALGAGGMAAFGGNAPAASSGPEIVNPNQVIQQIQTGKIANSQDLQALLSKARNKNQVWLMLQTAADMQGSSDADAVVKAIALKESAICPVCGCTPCNCTHIVKEGASVQDVFNAITYRIERQMPELFTSYGVEVVANAIRDVAEFHEGAEELGSSDVGGMVREVVRQLKHQELRKSLDEVKKMSTQDKFEKHLAKHGYDVNEKQKYWEKKIKDIDAQIAAWDKEMAARKSGMTEAKGLNKRVRVVKTGETGTIRQVKHGAFKGAPKSYFVDLDNGKQADNLPASALRLIKDGVAEGEQLDEASYRDVIRELLDRFYKDVGLPPIQGNHLGILDIKSPGTRVWTRGDGVRHRDPGYIVPSYWSDEPKKGAVVVQKFWQWLQKQPGVRPLGQISGEFSTSKFSDMVGYKGLYFAGGQRGVEFGSASRFKNPRSVWRHNAPNQGVAEGEYDPSYDPDYRPYQKPEQDPDAWKQERDLEEPASPTTVTVKDLDGNVVLTFPSTGGYYGDVRYAKSKGFDTEAGEYDIKWQKNEDYGTGIEGGPQDTTSPIHSSTVAEDESDFGEFARNLESKLDLERLLEKTKPHLTDRQYFVISNVINGESLQDLANELGISVSGVKTHLITGRDRVMRMAKRLGLSDEQPGEHDNWVFRKPGKFATNKPLPAGVAESNYWTKLQQERYLKEHKKVASLVNELTEIFKDK